MKVAIIAATGRTGRRLVQHTLEAGHDVTAFTRHPERLEMEDERLDVVQGDVQSLADVERTVRGRDAVLSGLGPTPSSPDDLMTRGATHVLQAMGNHHVDRLIWLTGAGVEAEGDEPSLLRRLMPVLLRRFASGVFEDSGRGFEVIRESDLERTVVRVPRLKEGPAEGGYQAAFKPPGPQAMARGDVAAFMLEQLEDDAYVRRAPMLTQ